jgi:hypothetical protein
MNYDTGTITNWLNTIQDDSGSSYEQAPVMSVILKDESGSSAMLVLSAEELDDDDLCDLGTVRSSYCTYNLYYAPDDTAEPLPGSPVISWFESEGGFIIMLTVEKIQDKECVFISKASTSSTLLHMYIMDNPSNEAMAFYLNDCVMDTTLPTI